MGEALGSGFLIITIRFRDMNKILIAFIVSPLIYRQLLPLYGLTKDNNYGPFRYRKFCNCLLITVVMVKDDETLKNFGKKRLMGKKVAYESKGDRFKPHYALGWA